MTTEESKPNKIQFDVGGTLYKASRQTLTRFEGSMLASLTSDHLKEGKSNEPIFIDRGGRLFEYVLDYLHMSKAAFQKEFDFDGIDVDMS
jgi:hypothetical protein